MKIIISRAEYVSIRNTIANINTSNVTMIWNRFMDPARTTAIQDKIVIEVSETDALEFLKILEDHSVRLGSLCNSGFTVTAIPKWKSLLSSLGMRIQNTFSKW